MSSSQGSDVPAEAVLGYLPWALSPGRTWATFLIEQTEKGPQAVDVARMDEEMEEGEE